ncbi:MAG: hypothetical protein M3Z25_07980 [Actinomycetota bacterium]|nr:hypothetical protein [Actinomycetota bacterium]
MSTLMLDACSESVGFADGPIASHSAQFGLARPAGTPAGHDTPSPAGLRPWNLRNAQIMTGGGARLGAWRYDHVQQVALTLDGQRVIDLVDASAKSVSDLDGDEGKSEDWSYDFCPDNPGSPV